MFGDGQMKWLKDSLKSSTATFKVIANGNSMVVDFHHRHEVWDNFGSERDDFLQWLFDEGINGVFFIVGDWHIGTLNKLYRPGDGYPLFELLSSNVAVRREPIGERPKAGWRDNPQSVVDKDAELAKEFLQMRFYAARYDKMEASKRCETILAQ